jgi:hypothetical protein
MAVPRLAAALDRIHAAATRLEELALAVPAAGDPALAERHRRLQAATLSAIARIDRLIGEDA